MKKSLAIILTAVTLFSLSACGKKAEQAADSALDAAATAVNDVKDAAATAGNEAKDAVATAASDVKDAANDVKDAAATAAAEAENIVGTAEHQDVDANGVLYGMEMENAIEQVDMAKVDGTELKQGAAEDSSVAASGDISNFKVSIKDAKVIDYDNSKVVVISYEFKNGNSVPQSFDSMIVSDVTQGNSDLTGASVFGVEGVNVASCLEDIPAGETKTVQKAFTLKDETEPIQVIAYKYGEMDAGVVGASFNVQ